MQETKATSDYMVDAKLLKKPFKRKGSVIFSFCKGCGTLSEINATDTKNLSIAAGMEGIEIPETFKGEYFETGGCDACDSDDKTVHLKNIA